MYKDDPHLRTCQLELHSKLREVIFYLSAILTRDRKQQQLDLGCYEMEEEIHTHIHTQSINIKC